MTSPAVPLAAGLRVADGRYRLRARYAADHVRGVEFWRGTDERLRRDVALTVLTGDRSDEPALAAVRHALAQAGRADAVTGPAIAPVLDVFGPDDPVELGPGVLGVVVATWTPGRELLVATRHLALTTSRACRMALPLATAVHLAHRRGVAVGLDCPQRIIVTEQNALTLAFPGPKPGATTEDDVHGIAALLCLLLSGTWPVPDGPVPLPDTVPRQLALAVALSLDGAHTAGPLLATLEEMVDAVPAVIPGVIPGDVPRQITARPTQTPSTDRPPRRHWRGLVVAAMVLVVVVMVTGAVFVLFGQR